MEGFFLFCLLVVLLIRWLYLRNRFEELEERVKALERARAWVLATPPEPAPAPLAPTPSAPPAQPTPAPTPPVPKVIERPLYPPRAIFSPPAPATAHRSSEEWETLVGGNWLNKVGVFVLVIGIALALGYSFAHLGPGGRVSISIAISIAMLITGAVLEPRERYRTFARGLLGGGWAALYFTVYAMQSLEAARIIHNPWTGAFLLLAVAIGMILHSLRYCSETVTGLAYFLAFVTLAITQVTSLSVIALIPLAVSLLYVAYWFAWRWLALFGLAATYITCFLLGDTGAPLWQAQAIFAVYWLVFEAFDILRPHRALLPLNAIGFLGLSLAKWNLAAPDRIWELLAATAVGYLTGAILRARSGRWHAAATLTAALTAAAIFLKFDYQWIALALLIEGELFYLAGILFRAPYLRYLAASLFTIELGHLVVREVPDLPARSWTPVAAIQAAFSYINRALRGEDKVYSYAAAGIMALVARCEVDAPYLGRAWYALAAATFAFGWWGRLADFRFQAYAIAILGALATAIYAPHPPLALAAGAVAGYAAVLCALWSAPDRFLERERGILRFTASLATTGMLAALVWKLAPSDYVGLAWMALSLVILEAGMHGLPREFRRQSYVLAALGAALVVTQNLAVLHNYGPLIPRLIPLGAAVCAYATAARAHKEEDGRVLDVASFTGTGMLLVALWALLPPLAVGPAWAATALALAEFSPASLRLQADLVSLAAFARLFFANFEDRTRIAAVVPVILSHYYLWWRKGTRFYLHTAGILAAALLWYQMDRLTLPAGWALLALALFYAGVRRSLPDLCWQSYVLGWMVFTESLCMSFSAPLAVGCIVIASLYAAQFFSARGSGPRMYYSLVATLTTASLLYFQVSGSLLTVAWGIEGVALLVSGFPLRDRVPRLSGMALLSFCILKLFVWDLRHLETLPRIFSFLVLGLILVGVSWIYTRFRERVARYL